MSGEMQEPDRAVVLKVVRLIFHQHHHQLLVDISLNCIHRPKPATHGSKTNSWILPSERLGACQELEIYAYGLGFMIPNLISILIYHIL